MPLYTPFYVAKLYTAIKLTFDHTSSFSFHKFGVHLPHYTQEAFLARNDRTLFLDLANKYEAGKLEIFLVANFMMTPLMWVGDLLMDESHDVYLNYLGRLESLEYLFIQDMKKLISWVLDNTEAKDHSEKHFMASRMDALMKGPCPVLVEMYKHKDIFPETMVILNAVLGGNLYATLSRNAQDDILWPRKRWFLEEAYGPFLEFDLQKYGKLVKGLLTT